LNRVGEAALSNGQHFRQAIDTTTRRPQVLLEEFMSGDSRMCLSFIYTREAVPLSLSGFGVMGLRCAVENPSISASVPSLDVRLQAIGECCTTSSSAESLVLVPYGR